jgi:hypothetical protein
VRWDKLTGINVEEDQMAKGQKRSTREKKKPKADKKAAPVATSRFGSAGSLERSGQGPAKKGGR